MKTKHKKIVVRVRKYSLGIIVAVSLICVFLIARCQHTYQLRPYYLQHWSEFRRTCDYVAIENDRLVPHNKYSNYYITSYLSWISAPSQTDTLSIFSLKGRRGYLNLITGKPQIEPIYRHAWPFSEGLAAVDSGGRIGFIDPSGKTRIPFKFFSPHPFRHVADLLFAGGYCSMRDTSGLYGLIDRSGNWVLKPVYDFVNNPVSGLRIVKYRGMYGLMDKQLQLMLPCTYNNIEILKSGIKAAKDGGQQLLSLDAKRVLKPFVCDMIESLVYESDELDSLGYSITKKTGYYTYNIYTKWGLMGADGTPVTKAIYDRILGLSRTHFLCEIGSCNIILNGAGEECGE